MSEPRPSGARRAARAPRSPLPRPPVNATSLTVAVVLVAVVLVLLTPGRPGTADRPTSATGQPVTRTVLGCPRSPVPEGVTTRYGVAAAEVDGYGADGEVSGTPRLDRGEASDLTATTVTGVDGLAQGLFAWRADSGPSTAVTTCPSPRASWWFTAVGASLEHQSTLVLDNLDSGPAEVDIRVLTPEGEIDLSETGGTGITIRPGGHLVLPLVELAPQNDELAVHVHATRGRIVAAAYDRFAPGPTAPSGYEWIGSQVEPARTVRLSGAPGTPRSRTLLVANPSTLEAVVSVELDGPSGRVLPPDLDQLSVDPGALVALDLTALASEDVAVRVVSDRPVVASLRSVVRDGDIVYAGPAGAVTDAAALPTVGRSVAHVTALGATARVTLTAYSSTGEEVERTTLALALHETATWRAPDEASYVVLEPTQGPVVGSMVYGGAAAVAFQELPATVRIPVVRPAA
ncbi:MAG TPA: DUF5719 family protein [Nocardioidaceae bacterium]|nr:DUF5719 family protein [Nocardioidaceae bacterium]